MDVYYIITRMSYPEKYKIKTLEYRLDGHTLEQTSKIFNVPVITIREWEKQFKEEGNLKKHSVKQPFKKIEPEKLKEYIEAHPAARLREIALAFECSQMAVSKALKRLNITRKK